MQRAANTSLAYRLSYAPALFRRATLHANIPNVKRPLACARIDQSPRFQMARSSSERRNRRIIRRLFRHHRDQGDYRSPAVPER